MTERFDKFTERARKTLQLAQEEAQRFNHNYIGTEHVLLGLLRVEDGVAARVLYSLGVELNKVRVAVEFIIGRGDRMVMGEVGLTPRAKRVIELGVDEARRLNHHYIGTEHLLLGLIREGEGIAAGVLESLGVSLEKVRAATIGVLRAGQSDAGQPAGQAAAPGRFDAFTERARKTLQYAQEEALRLKHNYIGPEHILLGLLREGDGVAARVLQNLGIDFEKARAAVKSITGDKGADGADSVPKWHSSSISTSEIGLSEDGKRVLELAVDESRQLNHHYVGTEHLLLGVLRETDSVAANVLESLGVTLENVRAEVIKVLKSSSGYTTYGPGSPDEGSGGSLSYGSEVKWVQYLPPDVTRELLGRRIRGPRFRIGRPRRSSKEARSLRQWVDAELDFHTLKHVDNSFLAVLRNATPISLLLERSYIGTDHFLAAMLRDENSAASQLLREHRADLDQVYGILAAGIGERWSNPFTYEAMRTIRIAIDDARASGVKATATHLLLGIMLEGNNTAYLALTNAGVTAHEVRALLSGGDSAGME